MKKHVESEDDTQPLSFASGKKSRRGKECYHHFMQTYINLHFGKL